MQIFESNGVDRKASIHPAMAKKKLEEHCVEELKMT